MGLFDAERVLYVSQEVDGIRVKDNLIKNVGCEKERSVLGIDQPSMK